MLKDWLQSTTTQLVVYAEHRLLLVSLHTQVGPVQVAVGHALDKSYAPAEREAWWVKFTST